MTSKDPQALRDALATVARAIEDAVYLTRPGIAPGLTEPADACAAIRDFAAALEGAPQFFRQLAAWLEAEQKAGRITHDKGGSAQQSVTSTGAYLSAAGEVAGQFGTWLAKAQNEAAHLKAAD